MIDEFDFEETEDSLSQLIKQISQRDDCPYDFHKLVRDSDLAEVMSNRWKECNRTIEVGAYLSTIILLGSILEGVLLDRVQQYPEKANNSSCAPKRPDGSVRTFGEWALADLISVSHEQGWLDRDVRDFSSVLRDYRNLVHPREQINKQIYPDEGTCKIAREVVGAAIDDLAA
mgnify:CR=1 FL=1